MTPSITKNNLTLSIKALDTVVQSHVMLSVTNKPILQNIIELSVVMLKLTALSIIMLNVIWLSIAMLNVYMLIVIVLIVIMLIVVAPI
jgi:hypothetical protein